jgi:cell filamentation protein
MASERDRLEALYTFARGHELADRPVQGAFDAAHLREINRRLFQDMPGLVTTM